jgi:uncharacterized repeat protein (TIGR04076 family)
MRELVVTVTEIKERCGAKLKRGDAFYIRGKGRLELPPGQQTCIYALQSIMPFLILKQMQPTRNEPTWIPEIVTVCCPDPKGVVFEVKEI